MTLPNVQILADLELAEKKPLHLKQCWCDTVRLQAQQVH